MSTPVTIGTWGRVSRFEPGELANHGRNQITERIKTILPVVLLADDVWGQNAHEEDPGSGHFLSAVGVYRGLDTLLRLPTVLGRGAIL